MDGWIVEIKIELRVRLFLVEVEIEYEFVFAKDGLNDSISRAAIKVAIRRRDMKE